MITEGKSSKGGRGIPPTTKRPTPPIGSGNYGLKDAKKIPPMPPCPPPARSVKGDTPKPKGNRVILMGDKPKSSLADLLPVLCVAALIVGFLAGYNA